MTKESRIEQEAGDSIILREKIAGLTGVTCLTINRPHVHNALDEQVIEQLTRAYLELGKDPTVRAIVLASHGSTFSAGADLNWMKRAAGYSVQKNKEEALCLSRLLETIDTCPKATIARIQGPAYGGGVGLIAACDIAICEETAHFCLSEVKLGLTPAVISPYIINAIGHRQARRYAITADHMSSTDAKHFGLVHDVVNAGELDATVESYLVMILKGGPHAIAATKDLLRYVNSHPIDDAIHQETAKRIASIRTSKEGSEGIDAFLTKRLPAWVQ